MFKEIKSSIKVYLSGAIITYGVSEESILLLPTYYLFYGFVFLNSFPLQTFFLFVYNATKTLSESLKYCSIILCYIYAYIYKGMHYILEKCKKALLES